MEIRGKTALVTGAGSGIGRATAMMLAREGAGKVVLADVDEQGMAETAAAVENAGATAQAVIVDVGDLAALNAIFSDLESAGELHIIFNNAGIMSGAPTFPDTPLDKILKVFAVNQLAVVAGTKLGIDIMRRQGVKGVIVNTSSIAALSPLPPDPAYAASKAAILMFTQSCKDVAELCGVRVNTVLPGITDTAIIGKTGDGGAAEWLEPALTQIRMLSADDVARAVIGLIRDDTKAGEQVTLLNEPA